MVSTQAVIFTDIIKQSKPTKARILILVSFDQDLKNNLQVD